jgi:hypothetical protein
MKHSAMNARTPHLLAGRLGRDEPPHPMWQCLAQAPGDGYWQRVQALAAAAGYVTAYRHTLRLDVKRDKARLLLETARSDSWTDAGKKGL